MPLVPCYEIYLSRDHGRPIYLTRVRDASNALSIARYQVQLLNESWLHRVAWTASVNEVLVDEVMLDDDEIDEPLKQGDTLDGQVRLPDEEPDARTIANGEAAIRSAIYNAVDD